MGNLCTTADGASDRRRKPDSRRKGSGSTTGFSPTEDLGYAAAGEQNGTALGGPSAAANGVRTGPVSASEVDVHTGGTGLGAGGGGSSLDRSRKRDGAERNSRSSANGDPPLNTSRRGASTTSASAAPAAVAAAVAVASAATGGVDGDSPGRGVDGEAGGGGERGSRRRRDSARGGRDGDDRRRSSRRSKSSRKDKDGGSVGGGGESRSSRGREKGSTTGGSSRRRDSERGSQGDQSGRRPRSERTEKEIAERKEQRRRERAARASANGGDPEAEEARKERRERRERRKRKEAEAAAAAAAAAPAESAAAASGGGVGGVAEDAAGGAADSTPGGDQVNMQRINHRLRRFVRMSKLKKVALNVIAQQLTETEIGHLRGVFEVLDSHNKGVIGPDELQEVVQQDGIENSEEDVLQLLQGIDIDGSNSLNYREFLAATMERNIFIREENIRCAFDYFDLDGNSEITLLNLVKIFGAEEHAREIMGDVNLSGEGAINYDEFKTMMMDMPLDGRDQMTPRTPRTPRFTLRT